MLSAGGGSARLPRSTGHLSFVSGSSMKLYALPFHPLVSRVNNF